MKININGNAALKAALEKRQKKAEQQFNDGFNKAKEAATELVDVKCDALKQASETQRLRQGIPPAPPLVKPVAATPKPSKAAQAVMGPRKHVFASLKKFTSQDYGDICEEAGYNFTAVKRNMKIDDGTGNFTVDNPDKVAIFNNELNRYLGTVGSEYGIVQYQDMLRWTEVLVKEGHAAYTYGGITGDGRRAFLVMKTADYLEITPGDTIDCYFYVTTCHTGAGSLSVVPTPYRRANHTSFNFPGLTALKFRHTKNVNATLAKASQTLVKVRDYFGDFEVKARRMAGIQLTTQQRSDYLKMLIPDSGNNATRAENMRGQIDSIIQTERSLQFPSLKGTLLGAFFGVVHFCDHYMTVRKSSKNDELTARIESKLDGSAAQRKAEALAVALELHKVMGGE